MMEKLKPCPFCGGEVTFPWGPLAYTAECVTCSCTLHSQEGWNTEDAVKAWNKRTSPWVSVEERLPEKEGDYICHFRTGIISTAQYDENGFFDIDYDPFMEEYGRQDYSKSVTHWMPLPKAPNE